MRFTALGCPGPKEKRKWMHVIMTTTPTLGRWSVLLWSWKICHPSAHVGPMWITCLSPLEHVLKPGGFFEGSLNWTHVSGGMKKQCKCMVGFLGDFPYSSAFFRVGNVMTPVMWVFLIWVESSKKSKMEFLMRWAVFVWRRYIYIIIIHIYFREVTNFLGICCLVIFFTDSATGWTSPVHQHLREIGVLRFLFQSSNHSKSKPWILITWICWYRDFDCIFCSCYIIKCSIPNLFLPSPNWGFIKI